MGSVLSSSSSQYRDPSRVAMRGVMYEDDVLKTLLKSKKREAEADPDAETDKMGLFTNLRAETLSGPQLKILQNLRNAKADPATQPEAEPYTFWERTSLIATHVSRLQPRIYYYPTADFSQYHYDDMSPEEKELKGRWMAKIFDFGWQFPLAIWSGFLTVGFGLPPFHRWATLAIGGYVAVFSEWCRVYNAALPERQDLDDFIVAKEIWYMKNVEAQELGLDATRDLFE